MNIDWAAEANAIEGDIERQLKKALARAPLAKSVIIVLEETSADGDGTFISMFSSEMSSNEQMGILYRALAFSEYGNRDQETYGLDGEDEDV